MSRCGARTARERVQLCEIADSGGAAIPRRAERVERCGGVDLLAGVVVRLSIAGDADQSEEFAESETREAKAHGHARSHENQFAKCGHAEPHRKRRARQRTRVFSGFARIQLVCVLFRSARLR